jgi:GNAT superfamily N-acetyltransferase
MPAQSPETLVRRAKPSDAEDCGRICFEAFATINRQHGFPPDLPSAEAGIGLLKMLFSHPGFFCVVAEEEGRLLGSNCADERAVIAGIGPITVDPNCQNRSVGKLLMRAVVDHALGRGAAGVRLLQGAFHNRSLSLYTKLGFDPREPMSIMQGPAIHKHFEGCVVRKADANDVTAVNRVCMAVHGHLRAAEFSDGIDLGTARVVERHGQIAGYCCALGFHNHAAGLSNLDIQALIAAADQFGGAGIIVPTRNAELFRWCLNMGLKVVYPMTLMSIGLYNEPRGAYLPSVLY